MSELDARCLEEFPAWLGSLPEDARAFAGLLGDESAPAQVRAKAAQGLSYLVKSLDLIRDGIEDLGFIDDAFVLRLLAASTVSALAQAGNEPEDGLGGGSPAGAALERLASDVELIEGFLGPDFDRLVRHVNTLDEISVRGRGAPQVLADREALDQLCGELRAWADRYEAPAFSRDPKNLVKLRAFMKTKLPE
jgi:hypothetical protein